jgi:hypothetical protein
LIRAATAPAREEETMSTLSALFARLRAKLKL